MRLNTCKLGFNHIENISLGGKFPDEADIYQTSKLGLRKWKF